MKSDDKEKVANIVPFGLRMQPDLKRQVEAAARANGRSLNAEITHRLEATLQDNAGVPDFIMGDRIDTLEKELAALRATVGALSMRVK